MRPILFALLVVLCAGNHAPAVSGDGDVELFKDDFSRFPPGLLSAPLGQLNGAIQEYHYIEHRGVATYPWRNPIVHLDTWAAGDEPDGPYLEQHTVNADLDRPDLSGLQILIATFWRNPGIITLLDADASILAQREMVPGSTHLEPVNWRGDGQEFALLSGNVREGGMIDGQLRQVVMFPDDGHPDLASAVRNLTGDPRDEVVLWDQTRVWIYTQDRPFAGSRIYAPTRNPHYNDSNYRSTVSMPGWTTTTGSSRQQGR